jgi:hypothetical protein
MHQSNITNKFQAIQGISPTTAKLIERLKDGKPGDVLSDAELGEICGRETKPGEEGYQNLRSAIRYTMRHHNVYWERIIDAGQIKCLNGPETLTSNRRDFRMINRRAKFSAGKLRTVNPETLNLPDRSQYFTNRAQLGALTMFSATKTTKRLDDAEVNTVEKVKAIQEKSLRVFTKALTA